MRFFDRTEEIASLKEIQEFSKHNVQFTVVTRRRRIGKTHLVWKAYEDQPILYFFVARKEENEIDIVAENELDQQVVIVHSHIILGGQDVLQASDIAAAIDKLYRKK